MTNAQSKINSDYYDFKELCENIKDVIFWTNTVDRVLEKGGKKDGGVEYMKVYSRDMEKLRRVDAECDMDIINVFYRYTRGTYDLDLAGSCVCENSYLYWLRKEDGVKDLLINKTWSEKEDNFRYNPDSEFHYFISYMENGIRMMEDCSNGCYVKMPLKEYKTSSAYQENKCWTNVVKPKYTKEQALNKWKCDLVDVKKYKNWEYFFHYHEDPKILASKMFNR